MRLKFLTVITIATLFVVSCKEQAKKVESKESETTETKKVESEKKEPKKKWAYTGETSPEHWAELKGDEACGGKHQSPVNIIASDATKGDSGLIELNIHYTDETTIDNIVNNGHSIQYNFKGNKNYVNFKERRYNLAQFHFHAPSEHTINGVRFPLVMHMVHVSEEKDFLVVAKMFEHGEENESFEFLESYLPINPGEEKAINKAYDFSADIPESFDHFYYKGSLTTPPCTEAVNWFVFTTPEFISEAQVKALSDLMPVNNFRPAQPLNDRTVTSSK